MSLTITFYLVFIKKLSIPSTSANNSLAQTVINSFVNNIHNKADTNLHYLKLRDGLLDMTAKGIGGKKATKNRYIGLHTS